MAIAYHVHEFLIPTATNEEASNGTVSDRALVPSNLPPILSTKQDLSTALTSIAGLSTAADQMIYTTAENAYATTALTSVGRDILAGSSAEVILGILGGGTSGIDVFQAETAADIRALLDLEPGTDVQAQSPILQDIVNGVTPFGNLTGYDTLADFEAASIGGDIDAVRTAGYTTAGDGGGALYKRIATPDPVEAWHVQSADGAWWELAETEVRANALGAFPGVASDQKPALTDFIAYCVAKGAKGIIPAVGDDRDYRIDSTLVFSANDLCIDATGGAYFAPVDSSLLNAVQIGSTAAPSRMHLNDFAVDRTTYDGATENVGFLFLEANQSIFTNFESRFSKYNHRWAPTEGGNQQNVYINLQGIGGFINFQGRAREAGFFNENDFVGGRGFCTSNTNTNFRMDPNRTTGALFVATSGITGTFQDGETITGGTSGATATVLRTAIDGSNTRIYYSGLTGTFDVAETVTGGTSGASAEIVSVRPPECGHNRISMSLEGQGASGIYDNGGTNKWDQCRSEGVWSSGFFHICGPDCIYPLIISSRFDYSLDLGSNPDLRPTILTYTQGLYVTVAINGRQAGRLVRKGANVTAPASGGKAALEIRDEFSASGFSQLLDMYHGRDSGTSTVFRAIRLSDGLVRSSLTTDGRLTVARQLKNEQSSWNFEPLVLGAYALWVDTSGRLRIKNGTPASETDGTIVGTQT